ncbi:hypothetical protein P3X46_016553 [Hevea brasiliensis]|uniref:Phosphatidic acid phosphatase type 2/haloperoxidase domain-containing protein n=1 Tax=Hevea brasiliensis TaxID=3981 RepID=A0ABQ9M1L0_HEVBR|nr:probable lipid phosphate phosphatase beta isoform X2 [Hevea brasiliensis]KAJ9173415.1 hypothetical protein P3X46_016553 [Hevea brasiliensis]
MATRSSPLRHLLTFDAKFSHFLHSLFNSYLPASLHLVLELSADFRFSFPITLALCLSPLSPSLIPFLSPLLFGLLLDLSFVGLIKIIFRRPRPPYNPHMSAAVSADNYSFPSGHASRVFLVAALVSLSANTIEAALAELRASGGFVHQWIAGDDTKLVGIVVVAVRVWAAMTALSRVLLGRHFLIDVLAGACLGVFEGLLAFQFLRLEELLSLLLYQKVGRGRS